MQLPSRFLLYIANRTGADPFAGYILLDSVQSANGVWTLSVVPPNTAPTLLVGNPNSAYSAIALIQFKTNAAIDQTGNTAVRHKVCKMSTEARIESTNQPVHVYQITRHTYIIPHRQKRNVHIKSLPGTPHGPETGWIDGGGLIEHVSYPPVSRLTGIDPYVARQLLELAQIKHEMCPITAEEYITGQTAVMPCGHLFMRMAIEETFKKEANKCPACRRTGAPTFI
jgi:hypothetical protein